MNTAMKASDCMDLADVLDTVHSAINLCADNYAAQILAGDFALALVYLDQHKALIGQAEFLVAKISEMSSEEAGPAVDPAQLDLLGPVEQQIAGFEPGGYTQTPPDGVAAMLDAAPSSEDSLSEYVADTTAQVVSPVLKVDVEHAAKVLGELVDFFAGRGDAAEAVLLNDAQVVLLRSVGQHADGAAPAVQQTQSPAIQMVTDRMAEGEVSMALCSDFAVNPGPDAQLLVGLLLRGGHLMWTLAGDVPQGSFITLRQRLQMFADSHEAVALARESAAAGSQA